MTIDSIILQVSKIIIVIVQYHHFVLLMSHNIILYISIVTYSHDI